MKWFAQIREHMQEDDCRGHDEALRYEYERLRSMLFPLSLLSAFTHPDKNNG
jgi:hypothetical protein